MKKPTMELAYGLWGICAWIAIAILGVLALLGVLLMPDAWPPDALRRRHGAH